MHHISTVEVDMEYQLRRLLEKEMEPGAYLGCIQVRRMLHHPRVIAIVP